MLEHLPEDARQAFYEHLKKCTPWKNHPVLCKEGVDYKTLIPVTLHGDGAQFYREDEFFCWSWSSAWSYKGHIKDPMLIKYPIAIIPERCMKNKSEPRLSYKNTFCFFQMSPFFLGSLTFPCIHASPWTLVRCQVRSAVNKVIAEVATWSLAILASGIFPGLGFYGEELQVGTYRWKLQGQQIAQGWKCFG